MKKKIFTNLQTILCGMIVMLLFCGINVKAQTVTLRLSDDAVAWSEFPEQTAPQSTLGGGNILANRYEVTVDEVTTTYNVQSHIKFDVSAFAYRKVKSAEFSTRGTAKTDAEPEIRLRRSGTAFTRDTTNWQNKPGVGQEIATKIYSTSSARRAYTVVQTRLVDYINEQLAMGAAEIAFALDFKSGSLDGMNWIGGKGDGAWGPELVIEFEQDMVYLPIDDASAFKNDPELTAITYQLPADDNGNIFVNKVDEDVIAVSYLKFELKGYAYKKISDAELTTRGASKADTEFTVQLRKAGQAFSRDTTNWGNRPSMSGKLATKKYTPASARAPYLEVGKELVNYINAELAKGNEVISFGLEYDSGDLDAGNWIGGKGNGYGWGPQLKVVPDFTGYKSQPLADAVAYEDPDATRHATNLFVSNVEGEKMVSYLKFDISAFAGRVIKNADFSIRGSMPAGQTMVMKLTRSGDDFTRQDITWVNKPATSGELATLEFFSPSQNVSFVPNGMELVNYINGKLQTGAQVVSFAIEYQSGDPKVNWIGGVGDGEGYRPILAMEFEFGGNLRSFADAVADQANPDVVWTGHEKNLKVDGTADAEIRSFVKFNIESFAGMEIIGAEFSTRGATTAADVLATVKLTESGADFARATTTWNNKPVTGAELAAKEYNNSSARRPYLNDGEKLVNYINSHTLTGKSELAFGLSYKAGVENGINWIGGFGDGSFGPELLLQVKRPLEGDTIFVMVDAFVKEDDPDTNFGDAADMGIRKSGDGTDNEVYIKFNISDVADAVVGAAKLTAYIGQHDSGTQQDDFFVDVYAVEDTTWEEMVVNWTNKPGAGVKLIEENVTWFGAGQDIIWSSDALTHYINSAIAEGREHVSFVLKGKDNTPGNRLWMAGREWRPLATSLILDYLVPPPSQSMPVVADSHVSQVEAERDSNFGTAADQHLINDDANEASKWIYFRYDLSNAYQEVVSATLNVYGSTHVDSAPNLEEFHFAVFPSTNVTWGETDITWNNKPDAGAQVLLTGTLLKGGRWFDLTSAAFTEYVNQAIRQGRDYITLVAKGVDPTPGERAWIAGREWRGSYITLNYEPEVALPTFSPAPGTYITSVSVNLNTPTAGASIYYTTDGSEPSETNGTLFVSGTPIVLTETTTIKAKAFASELRPSGTVTATYTVLPVSSPEFTPTPLVTYQGSVEVTISVQPAGSVVRYSDDGGAPTTLYDGPILLTETTTLRAQSYNADFTYSSPIVEVTYEVVQTMPAPGVGPAGVGFADLSRENQPALSLWLRAHDIDVNDGEKVHMWHDMSGNENHAHNDETAVDTAVPNTGENWKEAPTLMSDGLNSWPVVHFGTQFGGETADVKNLVVDDADNLDGGAGISIFLVVKRNQMFGDFASIFSKRDVRNQPAQAAYILEMDGGANPNKMQFVIARDIFLKSQDEFNADDYYLVNVALNSKHKLSTFMTNGELKSSALYQKPIQSVHAPVLIGGFQPVNIAEIIMFNSDVNMAQTILIKNYLAAKYGLAGVDGVHYTSNDYIYDIIGVGRAADLAGTGNESHLFSYGGGLQISAASFGADGDFVIAGHNGVALTEDSETKAWSRLWNVETAGNGGNVTLGFDFDAEGITSTPSTEYKLWYKASETAIWTDLGVTPTISGSVLNFAVTDIQDGIYTVGIGTVGIESVLLSGREEGFNIYPNPAKDKVMIQLEDQFNGRIDVRVRDIYGRLISAETVIKSTDSYNHEIDLSGLRTGTYMIEVNDNAKRSVKLFMVK
jgi:hypothetical protein